MKELEMNLEYIHKLLDSVSEPQNTCKVNPSCMKEIEFDLDQKTVNLSIHFLNFAPIVLESV